MSEGGFSIPDTCCIEACGQPSRFHPVILIWAKGRRRSHLPMTFELEMGFCFAHQDRFRQQNWRELIKEAFADAKAAAVTQGLAEPDIHTAQLKMLPLVNA